MPIKFDTLEYAKKLAEAGIPPHHADAHAQALLDALAEGTVAPSEVVVVRSDLIARIEMLRAEMNAKFESLRFEMHTRIEALRIEINAKLEALEQRINGKLAKVFWLIGLALALSAVQLTALGYIISRLP